MYFMWQILDWKRRECETKTVKKNHRDQTQEDWGCSACTAQADGIVLGNLLYFQAFLSVLQYRRPLIHKGDTVPVNSVSSWLHAGSSLTCSTRPCWIHSSWPCESQRKGVVRPCALTGLAGSISPLRLLSACMYVTLTAASQGLGAPLWASLSRMWISWSPV